MKKAIDILIVLVLVVIVSCQNKQKTEKQNPVSEFDLIADLTNFQLKMTELDTLKIAFDHSVCTYEGYEQIQITKQSDSIHIVSNFMAMTFEENPKWKKMYDKKISENDTIWKFEQFLRRNENRKNTGENKRGILMITNNKDTIRYSTDGLIELSRFLADYYETMKKIYPENENGLYGFGILEE